ncbi:MAG: PEGA domain-containing protein [Planctomycetes bacterium]|nr:PEGA domain-containing protein [Planctomycetota bacterium]
MMRLRRHSLELPLSIAAVALALLALTGCVERLLQVRSEPSGADVYLNGRKLEEPTPVDHPFSFYGTVSVVVRHEGHESRRVLETLSPPWYEIFPLDFFAEFLVPWKLRDHHLLEVRLDPLPGGDEDLRSLQMLELLEEKAERSRMQALEPEEDSQG